MNMELIGIGAIIGATLVTVTNIVIFQKNRKYELSKEQLIKLYNPLNALIKKESKYLGFLKINKDKFEDYAIEKYKFFLELMEYYNYSNKYDN